MDRAYILLSRLMNASSIESARVQLNSRKHLTLSRPFRVWFDLIFDEFSQHTKALYESLIVE